MSYWAIKVGLLCTLALSNIQSKAQNSLSARDSSYLATLDEELDLSEDQSSAITELFIQAQSEIDLIEQQKKELNQGNLEEGKLSLRLAVANQQIKDLRDERAANLVLLLNDEQKKIYQTKVSPSKPNVLHFGIHNRKDCRVCTQ